MAVTFILSKEWFRKRIQSIGPIGKFNQRKLGEIYLASIGKPHRFAVGKFSKRKYTS